MTVQEIQEIGFEKAVFGGYDMKSVDTFLERVAEEFAAMQKENAAMKAKMKVLVDKIEEYRGVEEGMHRTLLTAQSISLRYSRLKMQRTQMRLGRAMHQWKMQRVNSTSANCSSALNTTRRTLSK